MLSFALLVLAGMVSTSDAPSAADVLALERSLAEDIKAGQTARPIGYPDFGGPLTAADPVKVEDLRCSSAPELCRVCTYTLVLEEAGETRRITERTISIAKGENGRWNTTCVID